MVTHQFLSGGAPDSRKALPSLTRFGSEPALPEPHQPSRTVLQPEFLLKSRSSNWTLISLDLSQYETVRLAVFRNLESVTLSETPEVGRSLTIDREVPHGSKGRPQITLDCDPGLICVR